VTDCGCFGDALKLSPWGTFYKNVVLVVMILFLLARVKDIKAIHSKTVAKWISFIALFFALYISYYVLKHLPLIDFRPYAIGKNIPQGMTIPEDAKQPVYEDTWIYKVDGKDREYTTEEKPWTIEGATFVDRKTKLIEKGFEPSIHDFTMEKDGMDLTGRLMEKSRLMLIVMYDISKTDTALLPKVKELSERAMQDGYEVYAFSASSAEDFEAIKKEYGLDIDLLFCDETTLKTIIRANPGIVTLDKGTITGKWNATDADKVKL
ncbi:MAG: DoxX family protein, partial [Flavobacteriaceae bacterium]|nr:DoxX family protein [Flavobacteriaceae bacterium]